MLLPLADLRTDAHGIMRSWSQVSISRKHRVDLPEFWGYTAGVMYKASRCCAERAVLL